MKADAGYILVCDYHINDDETEKELSDKEKVDQELDDKIKDAAKYNDEVDSMLDSAFSSTDNNTNKKAKDNNSKSLTQLKKHIFETSVSARYSKIGKTLKTAFLLGPSDAVKKIYVEVDGKPDEEETKDNDKALSDEINKADKDAKKAVKKDNKNSEGLIQHNYSIFESYIALNNRIKNEAGKKTTNIDDAHASDIMKAGDIFESGGMIQIKVKIDKEGESIWDVLVNSDIKKEQYSAIVSALKAGKFKNAFNLAGQFTDTDGLVPIACRTYIYKEAKCHTPWLGHCRYGFAAGTQEDDPDAANSIVLAVAPFDASEGGKPDAPHSSSKDIVYKTSFNITGDISDGKLGALVNFFKDKADYVANRITGDRDNDDYDARDDDEITKYLKSRFKCIGDSSMFKQFNQIRDYIETKLKEEDKQVGSKKLEIDYDNSTVNTSYKNVIKAKKAFIFY